MYVLPASSSLVSSSTPSMDLHTNLAVLPNQNHSTTVPSSLCHSVQVQNLSILAPSSCSLQVLYDKVEASPSSSHEPQNFTNPTSSELPLASSPRVIVTCLRNNIHKPLTKLNLTAQLAPPTNVEPTSGTQAMKDPKWR